MTTPIYDFTTEYNVHCELPDCPKVVKHVYRINKEGVNINTCSTYHANEADRRWEEKLKKGIRPNTPLPPENNVEVVGDNLEEY